MSEDLDRLRQTLSRIDGRGYKAYKDIQGTYRDGDGTLYIDHVQGDPFAEPSKIRVRVAAERAQVRSSGASEAALEELDSPLVRMYRSTRAEGFGPEVKRRIMLGTYVLSSGYYDAYYLKALKVRTLIKRDFERAFEQVDVIASPVAPGTAFPIGEKTDDPMRMYLGDVYTISANLAGICAISVPCGFDRASLPVGLQLMGPALGEEKLLAVSYQYQRLTDHHTKRPPTTAAV